MRTLVLCAIGALCLAEPAIAVDLDHTFEVVDVVQSHTRHGPNLRIEVARDGDVVPVPADLLVGLGEKTLGFSQCAWREVRNLGGIGLREGGYLSPLICFLLKAADFETLR